MEKFPVLTGISLPDETGKKEILLMTENDGMKLKKPDRICPVTCLCRKIRRICFSIHAWLQKRLLDHDLSVCQAIPAVS